MLVLLNLCRRAYGKFVEVGFADDQTIFGEDFCDGRGAIKEK